MEKSSQKTASAGQGLDLATILNKAAAVAIKENDYSSDEVQAIIEKPGGIYKLLNDYFVQKKNVEEEAIIKLLFIKERFTIEETSGKITIADSKKTFESYIDPNFKNWKLNNKGEKRPETEVSIYEVARDATFSQIFNSINTDLDKLVWTQEQIVRFCKKYPARLRRGGLMTLFLIKENQEYFVVYVRVLDNSLDVLVRRFGYSLVWDGRLRHHIVVPSQHQKEKIVKLPLAKTSYVKLISGNPEINLEATDGSRFISEAKSTFESYIDSNFDNYGLTKKSGATKKTLISVYKLTKDGIGKEIFESFNVDLDRLVMTQHQIIDFCEKHPTWLRQNGNATLFLTKEGDNYFVVDVHVDSNSFYVNVIHFEGDHFWHAEYQHCVVVPQLLV